MEKAVLNVDVLKITQGMNGAYSHKGDLAIDMGAVCKELRAPFTGTIKRIYTNCNAVWLESNDKVKYADGTEDYMTVMTLHDSDVSNLKVGKVIKQNEVYYQPGTKGKVTGPHIHIAVGKGKFTGNGWYKNDYGNWCINNQYNIVKGLFLYDKVKIEDAMYDWTMTNDFSTDDTDLKYKIGDSVEIDGVYVSSTSDKKLTPAIRKGTITKIIKEARNPYLLDDGRIGWVNDSCIIEKSTTKYLNLSPVVSSWAVYKTNKYYDPERTSDILIRLNPRKFGGLSYKILEDMGNYHFKIETTDKGIGYIAGNPYKYSCTITDKPIY